VIVILNSAVLNLKSNVCVGFKPETITGWITNNFQNQVNTKMEDIGGGNILFIMAYPIPPANVTSYIAESINFISQNGTPFVQNFTKAQGKGEETLTTNFSLNSIQTIANCVTLNNTASCTWPIKIYFSDSCINAGYMSFNGNLAVNYNTQASTAINLKSTLINVNLPPCANGDPPSCIVNTTWKVVPAFSNSPLCNDIDGPIMYELGTAINLKITSNIATTKFTVFSAMYSLQDNTGVVYVSDEEKATFIEKQFVGYNCYQWKVPVATDVIKDGVYKGNLRILTIAMAFTMQSTLRFLQGSSPSVKYLSATQTVSMQATQPIYLTGNTYVNKTNPAASNTLYGIIIQ